MLIFALNIAFDISCKGKGAPAEALRIPSLLFVHDGRTSQCKDVMKNGIFVSQPM